MTDADYFPRRARAVLLVWNHPLELSSVLVQDLHYYRQRGHLLPKLLLSR